MSLVATALFTAALIVGVLAVAVSLFGSPAARDPDGFVRRDPWAVWALALTGAGSGGVLASEVLDLTFVGAIIMAASWALLIGVLAHSGLGLIDRSDERDSFERAKLVGMSVVVTSGIPVGRVGRVTVQYAGMTRSFDASSSEDIERDARVLVDDVVGGELKVVRLSDDHQEGAE